MRRRTASHFVRGAEIVFAPFVKIVSHVLSDGFAIVHRHRRPVIVDRSGAACASTNLCNTLCDPNIIEHVRYLGNILVFSQVGGSGVPTTGDRSRFNELQQLRVLEHSI